MTLRAVASASIGMNPEIGGDEGGVVDLDRLVGGSPITSADLAMLWSMWSDEASCPSLFPAFYDKIVREISTLTH